MAQAAERNRVVIQEAAMMRFHPQTRYVRDLLEKGADSAYVYCGTLDTPENKAFVAAYQAKYKDVPGPYPYLAYISAKAAIQALKDVNGKIEDKDAYLAALRKVKLNGPMGPVTFDDRQQKI